MQNTARKPQNEERKEGKRSRLRVVMHPSLSLSREKLPQVLVFVLYLALWAVVYIANTHYAEHTKITIYHLNEELQELRAEYLTIKSDLMYRSKQSEVARAVDGRGLQELEEPPKKLYTEAE